MRGIYISNIKIKNLNPMDFYNNRNYKMFSVGSNSSTLVPWYKELLKEVLGTKIDENIEDYALHISETQAIKYIFENKIDEFINLIENPNDMPKHRELVWKGKTYD